MENKEVTLARQQATKAVTAAEAVIIKSAEDLTSATEVLSKINKVGKLIKEKKEGITKPLNEALRNARALFKPIEDKHKEADQTIRRKMLDYNRIQEEEKRKEEERLAKRLEKGTMKEETVAKKLADIKEPEKKVSTEQGAIQYRDKKVVEITNPELLPREYLVPDKVLIRKEALAGKEIPGVKVKVEKTIANTINF